MNDLNNTALTLCKRAEDNELNLYKSFVEIGHVMPVMKIPESQIILGRRGTGKTHVLSYFKDSRNKEKDTAIYVDMRSIGSTGGIYADSELEITDRATRLLSDTFEAIRNNILGIIVNNPDKYDLASVIPILDEIAEAATEIVVEGQINTEDVTTRKEQQTSALSVEIGSAAAFTAKVGGKQSTGSEQSELNKTAVSGRGRLRIHFGSVSTKFRSLVEILPEKKLWILLDEWSEIPMDLQPLLADFLRRIFFPIPGISLKIAVIAHRSNFSIPGPKDSYIGIEVGADITPSINLDEEMVFDNQADRAKSFYQEMLYLHFSTIIETDFTERFPTSDSLIGAIFTQKNAFEEFVKATEGVPRDAINIIGIAAQLASDSKISVNDVRNAAKKWFGRAKQNALKSRPEAVKLLNWIVDHVIKHRQARAFLLSNETQDPLIDFLFDSRVLHLIKEGVSSHDQPGARYNVFSIDYGCYVDLINTANNPKSLFTDDDGNMVEVPQTDYRSIRRAILDLKEFYSSKLALAPVLPSSDLAGTFGTMPNE